MDLNIKNIVVVGKRKWQLNRQICPVPHPGATLEKQLNQRTSTVIKKLDTADEIVIKRNGRGYLENRIGTGI